MELRRRNLFLFALCCVLVTALTPFFGMSVITPAEILEGGPEADVFWLLRLPRALAAFFCGAGLAVSGMVFQAMFRNALASPFTLGVSSGAAFGASLYFRFGAAVTVSGLAGSLGAAMAGCFLSMVMVYGITRARGGFSTSVMLLAGVIINFFFSSMVMFVQYLSTAQDSQHILRWMMGSLSAVETVRLLDLCFVVLLGAVLIRRVSLELDLCMAGEEIAASRGVAVRRTRIFSFVTASVLVATVVSLAGPIGFVGMMIPHICRLVFGWSHRLLLPASFFLGGCFLACCDLLARWILAPSELPIGIITSMLGSPFFLWTLFRNNRSGLSI